MTPEPRGIAEYASAEVERDQRLVRRLQAHVELRFAARDLVDWWENAGSFTAEEGAARWHRLRAAIESDGSES